jgi:hypothetical protein
MSRRTQNQLYQKVPLQRHGIVEGVVLELQCQQSTTCRESGVGVKSHASPSGFGHDSRIMWSNTATRAMDGAMDAMVCG